MWVEHPRRRLLILEAPERERGTLVLQRVTVLPEVRRGELSLLSPDGSLVAIHRFSRDGNKGMLHLHFWNQRGRFLGEVAVSDLPANARGDLPYATRVWITPDNRYFVVWLEFAAYESLGYCVIRMPAETQPCAKRGILRGLCGYYDGAPADTGGAGKKLFAACLDGIYVIDIGA